jgi:hypothetical protein
MRRWPRTAAHDRVLSCAYPGGVVFSELLQSSRWTWAFASLLFVAGNLVLGGSPGTQRRDRVDAKVSAGGTALDSIGLRCAFWHMMIHPGRRAGASTSRGAARTISAQRGRAVRILPHTARVSVPFLHAPTETHGSGVCMTYRNRQGSKFSTQRRLAAPAVFSYNGRAGDLAAAVNPTTKHSY